MLVKEIRPIRRRRCSALLSLVGIPQRSKRATRNIKRPILHENGNKDNKKREKRHCWKVQKILLKEISAAKKGGKTVVIVREQLATFHEEEKLQRQINLGGNCAFSQQTRSRSRWPVNSREFPRPYLTHSLA